jgi:hypothetical protein
LLVSKSAATDAGRFAGLGVVAGGEESVGLDDLAGGADLRPLLLGGCDFRVPFEAVVSASWETSLDGGATKSSAFTVASKASAGLELSDACNLAALVPKHAWFGRPVSREVTERVPARGAAARKACRPMIIVSVCASIVVVQGNEDYVSVMTKLLK